MEIGLYDFGRSCFPSLDVVHSTCTNCNPMSSGTMYAILWFQPFALLLFGYFLSFSLWEELFVSDARCLCLLLSLGLMSRGSIDVHRFCPLHCLSWLVLCAVRLLHGWPCHFPLSTGSSFPADCSKLVPLAVGSLDSRYCPTYYVRPPYHIASLQGSLAPIHGIPSWLLSVARDMGVETHPSKNHGMRGPASRVPLFIRAELSLGLGDVAAI